MVLCLIVAGCGRSSPDSKRATSAVGTPAVRRGLMEFAACLRRDGLDVPASHPSSSGPVFRLEGLDVRGAKFKAAWARCRTRVDVSSALRTPERRDERGGRSGEG